jgi:hypothetical protein
MKCQENVGNIVGNAPFFYILALIGATAAALLSRG